MVAWLQSGPLLHVQNFNGCETKTTGTRAVLYTRAHCVLRCTMLACNHTDGVHIRLLSCIFLPLAYFAPHLLTSALLQQQGALRPLCLILGYLRFSLCNYIFAGTWHRGTEIQQYWMVERQIVEIFGVLLWSTLARSRLFICTLIVLQTCISTFLLCSHRPISSTAHHVIQENLEPSFGLDWSLTCEKGHGELLWWGLWNCHGSILGLVMIRQQHEGWRWHLES